MPWWLIVFLAVLVGSLLLRVLLERFHLIRYWLLVRVEIAQSKPTLREELGLLRERLRRAAQAPPPPTPVSPPASGDTRPRPLGTELPGKWDSPPPIPEPLPADTGKWVGTYPDDSGVEVLGAIKRPVPEHLHSPPSQPLPEAPEGYEGEIAKLKWGRVIFNPPLQMTVAMTERIEARVARSIVPGLKEGLTGPGKVQEAQAWVGPHMTAALVGDDDIFKIVTLNNAEQLVAPSAFTQWAWDVTPKRRGLQNLALRVTVRLRLPGHPDEVIDVSVLDRKISVRVNALHSAKHLAVTEWRWTVGTILSAVVAAILAELIVRATHK